MRSGALTPAVLAYEGIQYQNLAPQVMTMEQLDYLQEHLRILSGLYLSLIHIYRGSRMMRARGRAIPTCTTSPSRATIAIARLVWRSARRGPSRRTPTRAS